MDNDIKETQEAKESIQEEEKKEKTSEEIINELKKNNKHLILLARQHKDTIHRASMRINKLERDIFIAQNQVDAIGAFLIAIVNKFGENNKIELDRDEVELIPPGTMIDDLEEKDHIILKVIDAYDVPSQMTQHPQMRQQGPVLIGPDGKPIPTQAHSSVEKKVEEIEEKKEKENANI